MEGKRERRREVVSPEVRSAERTLPMGSAASEVSGEDSLFVGLDPGSGGSRSSGAGFGGVQQGPASFEATVRGRQEVRPKKTKNVKNQRKVLQNDRGMIFIER